MLEMGSLWDCYDNINSYKDFRLDDSVVTG